MTPSHHPKPRATAGITRLLDTSHNQSLVEGVLGAPLTRTLARLGMHPN